MGPVATLADAADMVRRRAGLITGVLVLGFLLSLKLGLGQSPVFEAREVMQVAPPKVSRDMAPTTVADPIASRLTLIRQRLLSDSGLAQIADAYGLFAGMGLSPAARAERLRHAVTVTWSDAGTVPVEVTALARLDDGEQARLVAQELAHRLINLSASLRIAEAQSTLDFLVRTEQAARRELSLTQARHAARSRAAGQSGAPVPAEMQAELRGYERDMDGLRSRLADAEQRRLRAETGLDLETRRQSEHLVVTDPAARPDIPVHDTRGVVVALGGGLSAALAFLAAWLLEIRHPVLRSAAQMQRMTGILPIATIPRAAAPTGWRARLRTRLRRLLTRTRSLV